jgi:hypothetical protein
MQKIPEKILMILVEFMIFLDVSDGYVSHVCGQPGQPLKHPI